MTKAEKYKIRYQLYRDLGYSPEEARALRSKALDVSDIKINTKTGNIVKGKQYRAIRDNTVGVNTINKYIKTSRKIKNDTTLSRWGMLTQDERYRDNTVRMTNYLKQHFNLTEDQSYYFLYYMASNNKTYEEARKELLSNRDFEEYDSRKKARLQFNRKR